MRRIWVRFRTCARWLGLCACARTLFCTRACGEKQTSIHDSDMGALSQLRVLIGSALCLVLPLHVCTSARLHCDSRYRCMSAHCMSALRHVPALHSCYRCMSALRHMLSLHCHTCYHCDTCYHNAATHAMPALLSPRPAAGCRAAIALPRSLGGRTTTSGGKGVGWGKLVAVPACTLHMPANYQRTTQQQKQKTTNDAL